LLDKIAASDMPETAEYRITVEAIARYRIKVCEENFDDPEKIEELIECGQVEELVLQAQDEMIVLDMYLEKRYWEKVTPNEVEWDWNPNPMDEHSWNLNEQENESSELPK
jgi:NADH dehydrogenase (ubiquinone) 1 alpha subcomplex subunit 5